MIKAVTVEFYKTRRRKVWLVVAALIAAQLLWSFWGISRMDARDLQQGWMFFLYQFPLLNSIIMPVVAAVVASRLCDMEHKGQTFRLLGTVMFKGRLFDAKFLNGALYMLAAVVLQVLAMLAVGKISGFEGEAPAGMFVWYLLFTTAVNLTLLLLQQSLSLLFVNQMIPLSVGVAGAFLGLFSLYFPQGFQKFILWSYYGVLMSVGMDWDRAARITNFYWTPVDWPGLLALAAAFCVIYAAGRALFIRKEL